MEVRVKRLKTGKGADKDEDTEEMIQRGNELVIDWIWKLCEMGFDSGLVTQ